MKLYQKFGNWRVDRKEILIVFLNQKKKKEKEKMRFLILKGLLSDLRFEKSPWDRKCLFRALTLTRTVLFRTRSYRHWNERTQNDSTPDAFSSTYREGCCVGHKEQECGRNPGALSAFAEPGLATLAPSPIDTALWRNPKASPPLDAGNRFRFDATWSGHLGWSGLLRPTLFSLSEICISLHAFSLDFSFARRFASYSFSSAMAKKK